MFIRHAGARGRAAFTLIEMLVVMTIIIILATLAVLLVPRFSDRQKVSMGASQLQGWLFATKQRAYRDKLVRGIRFLPVTSSSATIGPGLQTVSPSGGAQPMAGIHAGMAVWITDPPPPTGNPNNNELVTVLADLPAGAPTQFMANFAHPHPAPFSITPGRCTDLQYTEQPDNFTAGWISQGSNNPTPSVTVTFPQGTNVDLNQIVVVNQDVLYLRGGTEAHLITGVGPVQQTGPPTNQTTQTLALGSPLLSDIPQGSQIDYWIERAPRPLASEPILTLPQDIAVDFFPNAYTQQWQQNQSQPPYVYDVLFSPTGTVQQRGTALGKYIYWVRDQSLDSPFQGEPTLISVFTNTGGIAAHPINATDSGVPLPPVQSYYYFTQDARSSGM